MLELQDCRVDLERRVVLREGRSAVTLTEQEAELLAYLAARPGRSVSREDLLREVWEYAAGVVTRAVDIAVRRLRRKIEVDPAEPAHVVTVRGVGYRFEAVPVEEAVPPAERAPLPAERGAFVDRPERERLLELVSTARLVSVVGPPGAGKTRLALRVAHELMAAGRAVALVELSDAESTADLIRLVAAALGVPLAPEVVAAARADRLLRVLGQGERLVLLDNLEQLVDHAELLEDWLAACPGLRLVVTSQRRLRVPSEEVVEVFSLPPEGGLRLLVERARSLRPGWGEGDGEVLGEIVAALDGNPLAIELAAARAAVLPPRALHDQLKHRFRLLSSPGASDHRQATLAQALEWSWSLLEGWERAAFAQCGVFAGGFDLAAATAVVDLSDHPDAPWVLDWVQALVDRSLLRAVTAEGGSARFRLDESLRAFARRKAAAAGLLSPATARHRDHFLALGEAWLIGIDGPDGVACTAALAAEADNLRAVHRGCLQEGDADGAVRSALVLDGLLALRGPIEERVALAEAAVGVAREPAQVVRARVARCRVERTLGHLDTADGELAVAEEAGGDEPGLRGLILEARAELASARDAHGAAREAAEAALALAADPVARARAHSLLGRAAAQQGHLEAARVHYDALRREAERSGSLRYRHQARNNLGFLARIQGRHDEAEVEYREALASARALGDRLREGALLVNLGALASSRRDFEGALRSFREARALYRAVGDRRSEVMALGNHAILLMTTGRVDEARGALVEALLAAREVGSPRGEGLLEGNLGLCHALRDEPELAEDHLRRAVALLEAHGSAFVRGYFAAHLASVRADRDRLEGAGEALAIAEGALGGPDAHPVARALLELVASHLELARVRAGTAPADEVAPRVEARLASAEQVARIQPEELLGDAINSILPSELATAAEGLRRVLSRTVG